MIVAILVRLKTNAISLQPHYSLILVLQHALQLTHTHSVTIHLPRQTSLNSLRLRVDLLHPTLLLHYQLEQSLVHVVAELYFLELVFLLFGEGPVLRISELVQVRDVPI